jgi:biotin carboxyl carrier protein
MEASINDQSFPIQFNESGQPIDKNGNPLDIISIDENRFHVIRDNKTYRIEILKKEGKVYQLRINDNKYDVTLKDQLDLTMSAMGIDQNAGNVANDLKAPMPGLILDVMVNPGDTISKGQPLLILEAMKMENVIKSPVDGVVSEVLVEKGASVEKNKVLCSF